MLLSTYILMNVVMNFVQIVRSKQEVSIVSDDLPGVRDLATIDDGESANQEKFEVAAEYLGYKTDTDNWLPELLAQKRAKMRETTEFLRALTDESRLDIYIFLQHSNPQNGQLPSYTVSEIAERFNISMSTVSHHLQELKRVGIVKVERQGKERYYQIDLDYMIARLGQLYGRLLAKREMLRQGLAGCPMDKTVEILNRVSQLVTNEISQVEIKATTDKN
jgi:DNA-binding transcriptional ArsR family regulator